MSIDLSIFHAALFDETTEHLAEMEHLLVGLDLEAPEPDVLNAIFRAAHSIKGGSGTFGFTDMAGLTHVLESVLDLLRKGEMQPTREMVDTFLASVDAIQGQLAGHRAGQIVDPAAADAVIQRLERFLTTPAKSMHLSSSLHNESGNEPAQLHRWRLRFVLPAEAAKRGLTPLLEEWERHGTVNVVQRPVDESVEGSWEIHLFTLDSGEDIQEDLAFYADPAQIYLEPLPEEVETETSYGFFAPLFDIEATMSAEEADFGFFDGAPGSPSVLADPGYGLFEDAPGVPSTISVPLVAVDTSYGFFSDAPGAPVTSVAVPPATPKSTVATTPSSTVVPYGFFPNAPGAPTSTDSGAEALVVASAPSTTLEPMVATKPAATPTPISAAKSPTHKAESSSIRVSVEKVDQIMNLVGELVIAQSMLAQVASQLDPTWTVRLQAGLDQLDRNTRNLQESVMSIRMMPISVVFSRFPRLVRDLAGKLGKQVELTTLGEGTELDKGLTEKLTDPLTHLIRNSLDHGIEAPDVRAARGKDRLGHITLSASHQGGNVVIEVHDDGAGLNRARILAKARERGLSVNDGMSDQEVWQIIFAPGFSTADQVTDVSGRGVGMDVVRRNIQDMGGTVDINSMQGIGSTFTVRLPLTLAILDGLSVAVGAEIFIISLGYIMESMRPQVADIRTVAGRSQVVQVRGEYLPVLPLYEVLGITPTVRTPEEGILVLLEAEGRRIALFVDQLVGQHQVVIKSLESNFRRVDGISGATIMGDGRVALILDVGYLVRRATRTGIAG
ncbi:Chemotaxis protein CheA [Gammaproteobacteria bacterium]